MTRPLIISICVIILTSCSREKKMILLTDEDNDPNEKIEIYFHEASPSLIEYSSAAAINYAKAYALLHTNSCGIYNDEPGGVLSDCAHFISHCLAKGGIKIKAAVANPSICKDGLCYRVEELRQAFEALAKKYDNINPLDINKAASGDYALLLSHTFMVCTGSVNSDEITVYSHTLNRSCEKPPQEWSKTFSVCYHIADINPK
jgi:hypothetical protein